MKIYIPFIGMVEAKKIILACWCVVGVLSFLFRGQHGNMPLSKNKVVNDPQPERFKVDLPSVSKFKFVDGPSP